MKKLGKLFQLVSFAIIFFVLQSCVNIETNMKVKGDFTGESVSKIKFVKGLVTEEELKKELQEMGIQTFKLKKENSADAKQDSYILEVSWKNEEELRKFLSFAGRNGSVEELNQVRDLLRSFTGKAKIEAPKQPEGQDKDPKAEVKKEETKKVNIKDITKIFKKEKNMVVVNMGTSNIDKWSIKVDGEIVKEEGQGGVISSSKDEITFSNGENISFKYKTKAGMIGVIVGYAILIIMGIIGLIFLKRFNDKVKAEAKKDEENNDDSDEEEDEISDISENIVEDEVETVEDDLDTLSDEVLVNAENVTEEKVVTETVENVEELSNEISTEELEKAIEETETVVEEVQSEEPVIEEFVSDEVETKKNNKNFRKNNKKS